MRLKCLAGRPGGTVMKLNGLLLMVFEHDRDLPESDARSATTEFCPMPDYYISSGYIIAQRLFMTTPSTKPAFVISAHSDERSLHC
jgi:hypothetical protein